MRSLAIPVIITGCLPLLLLTQCDGPSDFGSISSGTNTAAHDENHLSPAENLERIDIAHLRQTRKTLDIAMYSFTDRYIAETLAGLASRGVKIRVYRDGEQFESEERRGNSTTQNVIVLPSVNVRVKPPSRNLMHMKAYVRDGIELRDGSANWSPSGEKAQDNNSRFTSDPEEIAAWERNFEEIWNRAGNQEARQ